MIPNTNDLCFAQYRNQRDFGIRRRTFEDARQYCQDNNPIAENITAFAGLAQPMDDESNAFYDALRNEFDVGAPPMWVGVRRASSADPFLTTASGMPPSITPFMGGEPRTRTNDKCIQMSLKRRSSKPEPNDSFRWAARPCFNSRPFMCQVCLSA